ncbi:isoamylase early set domain-containing protein [Streptosporangium sp. DT93]|uniref:isoamylase early set domain-containing protein n=1 Tax=Streptosporangium sp. DT93 TaxID=3393428 RepID=UPI003CEB88F3
MIKRGKPTKNGQVKLTFTITENPGHGGVSLVGDFNDWDPYAHPMERRENGAYQVSVVVPARKPIRFRYLADGGVWFDDADADHHDEHGGRINPVDVPEMPDMTTARTVGRPMRQTLSAGQSAPAQASAS